LLNWQHKSPRHSTTQCWYEVLSKGSICAGTSTNTRSSSNQKLFNMPLSCHAHEQGSNYSML
jgi:hypothetical protein